ncbi:hypothetical protein S83_035064 [Arachis hypogaea]
MMLYELNTLEWDDLVLSNDNTSTKATSETPSDNGWTEELKHGKRIESRYSHCCSLWWNVHGGINCALRLDDGSIWHRR